MNRFLRVTSFERRSSPGSWTNQDFGIINENLVVSTESSVQLVSC